jgi:hypothetical protein
MFPLDRLRAADKILHRQHRTVPMNITMFLAPLLTQFGHYRAAQDGAVNVVSDFLDSPLIALAVEALQH